ncbi:NACHT domain-containing protein [Stenotrophomonas sp. CCNWLW4]
MFSWLRRGLGMPAAKVTASHGGVAIAGNNLGAIYTGPVLKVDIEPNEVSDERLWERCVAAATSGVEHALSRQLFNDTIVSVSLIEIDTQSDGSTDRPQDPDRARTPLSENRVIELIASGRNVVLSGEGGIGKTTAALRLAKSLLDERPPRQLPLFLDAPAWASTGSGPLEFIASLSDYAASDITSARLARYAKDGRLTLFIDGWNEISVDALESVSRRMRAFLVATPSINIVLTTRNTSQRPDLGAPILVGVTGLDWRRQQEFVRASLPAEEANMLIARLSVQHRLRYAARNPLILRGVANLSVRDQVATDSFTVYHAIVRAYESDGVRSAALSASPLHGFHRSYLEAIAWQLNSEGGTRILISDARSVLAREAEELQSRRQIVGDFEPVRLLQELCDHHLLFEEFGLVRFAHQRFQEYFAASRYLSLLHRQSDDRFGSDILNPINLAAWEETLLLVAGELSSDSPPSPARSRLMGAAVAVDLHFASILSAASGFERPDNPSAFDELASLVTRLADSPVTAVREYGLACMIDSALPTFSDRIWHCLEQQDQQRRLHFHRLGTQSVAIRQLGADALVRLQGWSVECHVEFIHEVASNPANWEYLLDFAFNSARDELRVAAISAIRWEYPASDAALDAWLQAPDSVKLSPDLLLALEEELVDADEGVHAELRRLHEKMPEEQRHRIALRFQTILPRPPVEHLVGLLREDDAYAKESVLAMLTESDPEIVDSLAIEMAFCSRHPPEWVVQRVRGLDEGARASLFDRTLRDFPDGSRASYAQGLFAECANLEQVSTALREYLSSHLEMLRHRGNYGNNDRYFALRSLLTQMDGDRLIISACQVAGEYDFDTRREIAGLVLGRVDDDSGGHMRMPWLPTIEQTDALIDALTGNSQPTGSICALAEIASRVSPDHYEYLIAQACQWELDQWLSYRIAITQWVEAGRARERPMNPPNGILLSRVLARWGRNALPTLRHLAKHSQAEQFVFEAMATILQKPWRSMLPASPFGRSSSLRMTRLRRETGRPMLQPSSELQFETDAIASELVDLLNIALRTFEDISVQDRERQRLVSRVAALVLALARIPSPIGASPVLAAIASPIVGDRTMVDAANSLLDQGLCINMPELVVRLCTLWDEMAAHRWLDQSRAYEFRTLSHTVLRLPHELLPHPASHYLERWMATAGSYDVEDRLVADGTPEGFLLLRQILTMANGDSHRRERTAYSIVSTLSSENWAQFAEMLADGTFFGPQSNLWYVDDVAKTVHARVGHCMEAVVAILDGCARNGSRGGVRLGCLLLEQIHAGDQAAFEFATRVLGDESSALEAEGVLEFQRLFFRKQQLDGPAYRVLPIASNRLRGLVFSVAASRSRLSDAAKTLLCEVEEERRRSGRPTDEPRHPDLNGTVRLADILVS